MADTPESVVRTWFEDLWNRGDETTIDRLMHEDAAVHGLSTPQGGVIRGAAGFKPFYRVFREAFPDITLEVLHIVTEGDLCVAHLRATGTHRGDGLGFLATQRPMAVEGFTLTRIADGQIVEGWNCFDFLSMYHQLGVPLALPDGNQPAGG